MVSTPAVGQLWRPKTYRSSKMPTPSCWADVTSGGCRAVESNNQQKRESVAHLSCGSKNLGSRGSIRRRICPSRIPRETKTAGGLGGAGQHHLAVGAGSL